MPRHIHPTPLIICPPTDFVRNFPGLRHQSQALSRDYATGIVVSEEKLQAMGSALWSCLDLQAEFDAAHKQAGASILSIIIESSSPEVQALPWETLYHPSLGFIGKHPGFTLCRRMESPIEQEIRPEKGPLRILLFTSLPEDVDPETKRLNVEEEQAQVQEALMPWIARGLVSLEMPDDGRFATLQELLRTFQPQILFLSGHGSFHYQPHTGETPHGVFFFEDENGDSLAYWDDQIAGALIGSGVQAVVISACESSKAASDSLINGLTQHISSQGIPHVIGMRESIIDQAGIQFARALCDELARGERVDWALQAARIAIQTPLKGITKREAGREAIEELSLGQWCLPMLIAPEPAQPLIDWDFQPQQTQLSVTSTALSSVSLPARFIGRRAELKRYQSRLLKGSIRKLLITGMGGQGKTSLAGKLAMDLQKNGYPVFAWSAQSGTPWREFELDLEMALDETQTRRYLAKKELLDHDAHRARFLTQLLLERYNQPIVFFLDNLESLQDPDTLALTDDTIAAWLKVALATDPVILLVTSRWVLPGWVGEHLPLSHASYGDFLQVAQQLAQRGQLQFAYLTERDRLRQVYGKLGGNCRGLEWFAAGTLALGGNEQEAYLELLARTHSKLQDNIAIATLYAHLPETAKTLLQRLPVYAGPVPVEGVLKLALDLPGARSDLERLLAVSLVEAQAEADWETVQYQLPPVVAAWLEDQKLIDPDPVYANLAADYQTYLFQNERRTLTQAIAAHDALRRAERHAEADRYTLDYIVGRLTMRGHYAALLTYWLPGIHQSEDRQTRAEALGQTGKLLVHTGDYATALTYLQQSLAIRQQIGDKAGEGTTLNNISGIFRAQGDYATALTYLQQSLAICQQIGDKAGLCATLFNMGHIHLQNDQAQEAVQAWVTVYVIAKQINLAQALDALEKLAPQIGLPDGLAGWDMLAQRLQGEPDSTDEPEEESGLGQVEQFIHQVIQAARSRSAEAPEIFEALSKMAVDPHAPAHFQELARVLKQYMSGNHDPDLSNLPPEFAALVRKVLDEEG